MKNDHETLLLTHEHHLNHLAGGAPFIFLFYAIYCFVISRVNPSNFPSTTLMTLGVFQACMIAAFATYDLKYKVKLTREEIQVEFFGHKKNIRFSQIISVDIKTTTKKFSTLIIKTAHSKHSFYLVDDAEEAKAWIENQNAESELIAA